MQFPANKLKGDSKNRQQSLYVVRHGRTVLNVDDRYLGALDPPLDDLGLQQALKLAEILCGRVDVVVCSPKLRAMQTAEVIGSSWNVPFQVINEFSERNVGVYEGQTKEEARLAYPALWEQDITRQWDAGPPDGESIKAVVGRVAKGLQMLQTDFAGLNVVLVGHGFVSKVVRAILTNPSWEDFFRYSLKNGQVEHYHFSSDSLASSQWLQRAEKVLCRD
jgi:probable phosphoglycerate mutase